MPEITRAVAIVSPARKGLKHLWVGAGIPKDANNYLEREKLWAKMKPGLEVSVEGIQKQYLQDGNIDVVIRYKNSRAGHKLLTGPP